MTQPPDPADPAGLPDLPDDARPEDRPMAATSRAVPDHPIPVSTRPAIPFLAAGATFAAACAMLGVGAVSRAQGFDRISPATSFTSLILMAATLGALVSWLREGGLVLAWNALGIAIALLVIGLLNVGAIVAFPVALIGLALAAWPRGAERVGLVPCGIALIGGLGLIPTALGLARAVRWLAGMA
ncbi:MAG TPA: hypothetical protein VGR08_13775 [Thermomicrobiales bacterium]|nr:hypothetical protein [Thermomicrobiales bacterium]